MSKRNAFRIGNPHSAESIAFTIQRYGAIKPETLSEIVAWLEKHSDKYEWAVGYETIKGEMVELAEDGMITADPHPIIRTQRKGSAIFKILDNEHDAQNTLANIRNKDFPKYKQGQ